MKARSLTRRKITDVIVKIFSAGAASLGIIILVWVLAEVIRRGAMAINWDFFTKRPAPPGVEGGGMGAAILGTLIMIGLGSLIAVPVGMMAGIFLSEFDRDGRFGAFIRFSTNVMMGIPSIIVGLFVYTLIVLPMGRFSGIAGAAAMAVLMLPVVCRTAEDMLGMVSNSQREAAMALGAARWKVTTSVVFRAAKGGLITGVMLAVARVSGETAPLLFTALNSPYWPKNLHSPMSNMTVTIFNYAMSPYEQWQQMAWGASLLITVGVLGATLSARLIFRRSATHG